MLRFYNLLRPRIVACDRLICAGAGKLRIYDDDTRIDKVVYRCDKCYTTKSLRHGSIFAHSDQDLFVLCRLLVCFYHHITVTQATDMYSVSRDAVGNFYYQLRNAMYNYIMAHPIKFDVDEVIEADELYLHRVYYYDASGEASLAHWVVGMIGRESGKVYLDVVSERDSAALLSVAKQCAPRDAVIISDEWAAYGALDRDYQHKWCKKEKKGSHSYPLTYKWTDKKNREISVHTNTIEGFWSHFRAMLHWSRGWNANYIHYILGEFMYRKSGYPFLAALQCE